MHSPVPPVPPRPEISASQRRHIHQAKVLRGMAAASQVLVMIGLFVLWIERGMGFFKALELCFVIGVAAYVVLFGAAAVILVVSRLEPVALLVGPAVRLVSIVIYATLRYGQKVHWFKSVFILFVLYVTAWLMVRRIERHARRRFGW